MFVSHDKNSNKKVFQKPNILRKNHKALVKTTLIDNNGALAITIANKTQEQDEKSSKHKCSKPGHIVKKNCSRTTNEPNESKVIILQNDYNGDIKSQNIVRLNNSFEDNVTVNNNNDKIGVQDHHLDSYFNTNDYQKVESVEDPINNRILSDTKWSFISVTEKSNSNIVRCHAVPPPSEACLLLFAECDAPEMVGKDWSRTILPTSDEYLLSSVTESTDIMSSQDALINTSVPLSHVINSENISYKCDVPGCTKEFSTQQKMKKHKRIHDKNSNRKVIRRSIECPVKKTGPNQSEPCGLMFDDRENLDTHLKKDHTPDQAPYSCELCGRHFFWLSGLRAHSRAHALAAETGARQHACAWPGCGRVFPQACRLKEHARKHTGDKPYACRFPNCGWSFRTASKLLRHARRHTGDRRHGCGVCGRAFLRLEHLRAHALRHARPALPPRAPRVSRQRCRANHCEQTFMNMSSLCVHMKKVHKINEIKNDPVELKDDWLIPNNLLVVPPLETETEEEAHAARTHCAWPLAPRALDTTCVQVELSECSESNIYTVKSDLFLHGNDLNNEDSNGSDMCCGSEGAAEQGDDDTLDLLPAGDLMQEELLYTGEVGDESSLHVFLLNGDEINLH